jgi:hypothetical protein
MFNFQFLLVSIQNAEGTSKTCIEEFLNTYFRSGDMETLYFAFTALLVKNPTSYFKILSEAGRNRDEWYFSGPTSLFFFPFQMLRLIATDDDGVTENSFQKTATSYYEKVTNLEFLLSTLWFSSMPCFPTQSSSNDAVFVKKCQWKGIELPCSSIFSRSITDQGICCSFNKLLADQIYTDNAYSRLVIELEQKEKNDSLESIKLPSWFTESKEPNTRTGIHMGLSVAIDSQNHLLGPFSVQTDFQSLTLLIGQPLDFPLTKQKGLPVLPGHANYIALSATSITTDESMKEIIPKKRNCKFSDEGEDLKIHRRYSQYNCFMECSLQYAQNQMGSSRC